ncbi:MAG TPA: S16 family serine protease [Actinomycetota bacterium]|nr:S16 family serine protease [Actinomycetota bacterium]
MRSYRRLALILVPLILVVAATTIWLPYYSLGPGPAREVEPLIHVVGHPTYGSQGRFVMTSVRFSKLTALGALVAWLDPNRSVVGRGTLYAPGETQQQEEVRSRSQMDQSKLAAAYVVLSRLTDYPKGHRPGALVIGTAPGCPADGHLFPGDLITRIDGSRVSGRAQASRIIDRAASGSSLSFDVRAGGQREHVDLVRAPCGGQTDPVVGVVLIPNFPFRVTIESGEIGGPSAGLMWALGLYDLLTPGDLTGGRMIAGTGEIGLDGSVHPISGIGDKIVAAARAGAQVFLLPEGNAKEAGAAGDHGMTLVTVGTFQDALDFLQGSR